LTEVLMGSYIF